MRNLKSKIRPTKPFSPPYPPQGAVENRGFLGNYTDNLPCSFSGVLIQAPGASSTNIALLQAAAAEFCCHAVTLVQGNEKGRGKGRSPAVSISQTDSELRKEQKLFRTV